MDNPKIEAGVSLTLSELINRFLDWEEWNKSNGRYPPQKGCKQEKYEASLCCDNHMALISERDAFYRYFELLYPVKVSPEAFTAKFLKKLIEERKPEVDLQRIWEYFGINKSGWEKLGEPAFCPRE